MDNSASNRTKGEKLANLSFDYGGHLSDKERLLLMTFHDHECSFFNCWRAKRLLNRSSEAADFFNSLDQLCVGLKSALEDSTPDLKGSLWSAVSRRIDEEERAALYLGSRSRVAEKRRLPALAPLGWSMAGGLVAASLTIFISGNLQSSHTPLMTSSVKQAKSQPLAQSIDLVSQNDELPRILEPGDPRVGGGSQPLTFASQSESRTLQNSVDVDWVRSAGAVRFFSDPNQHSTMIWVKKRAPAVRFYSSPVKVLTPHDQASFGESLSHAR